MENIKDILDDSSQHNRASWLLFLSVNAYILIAVFTTTDEQLFFNNSYLKLPLLGIEIPILWFYILVPFVVVFLHSNFVINLINHRAILEQRNSGDKDIELFPFLYNFLFRKNNRNGNTIVLITF